MSSKNNNYAYIDGQNLNLGIQSLGWKLDYSKFRVYLAEKYQVQRCYLFLGYIPENQSLYTSLQAKGYILKFKPIIIGPNGKHKGNIDADMVLQIVVDFYQRNFTKALLITSDGDFYSVVKFLNQNKRLDKVLSPYFESCSTLLKRTAQEKISFMNNLRNKLEYKKKNTA